MTERRREDEGQSTVELVLVLPTVLVVALLVLQVALVARDQVLVVHAARVAARHAAIEGDRRHSSVRAVAVRSVPDLKAFRVSTETSHQAGSPGIVIVEVRYAAPTDVPLVGVLLPDVPLGAKAAMAEEPGQPA